MAIDLSQFYQVFFEETGEHLANMESLLLGLDLAAPDHEQLNAIFRAAHSIKGSSGTFGFTDMAEVTHVLENLLDRIRKDELPLREEMIDAFLEAGDVLKTMLAAHKGEGEVDLAAVEAVQERLRALTNGASAAVVPASTAAPAIPAAPVAQVPDSGAPAATMAREGREIHFILDGAPEDAQPTLDSLVGELADFGAVRLLSGPAVPGKPCIVELLGQPDDDALRGVIEFVGRSDSIRIRPLGVGGGADSPEGAYGFFAEESSQPGQPPQVTTATEETAYGLFEEPRLEIQSEASGSEAYGFFEEPVPSSVPAPSPAADESYGFFTEVAAPEPVVVPVVAPVQAPAPVADESFGFFTDIPAPPPAAAAEPPKPDERPAEKPAPVPIEKAAEKPAAVSKPASSGLAPAAPAAKAGAGDTTIRVGVEKVDQLINLVGELVITQAMLLQSASGVDPVQFERLHNGLTQLERNSRDLQEAVMSIRMMPISVVFSRFPRVVRELSQKLGKKVELKMVGEGTELDKSLIERITDPLTHLIRNSLDHGIEMPDVRAEKGKQPTGTITLRAYHQSGNIVIEVGDDGAGLNRQRILSKARERGLQVHDQMSDQEVWQLIFEAGFSTADQVTEVSGRGVGMDVVKRNINAMGGRVEIESMMGVGTRMTVRLPLTLAILDGMSIAVGDETYIVPLGYVIESLQAEPGMMKSISGVKRLLFVRGEYLPVVVLHEVFGVPGAVTSFERGIMVIIEADGTKAALFVDALLGQQQVVIKSLEANYRKVAGISGATIMGDGHVALILDVAVLADLARNALAAAA